MRTKAMKKPMPAFLKGKKDGKKPAAAKAEPEAMMADGDAAPKRSDRPARKAGGAVKKGGC